jgi:hypothetical protein
LRRATEQNSPISVWPAFVTTRSSPLPGTSSGRRPTWPPSRPEATRWGRPPTYGPSAPLSISRWRGFRPFPAHRLSRWRLLSCTASAASPVDLGRLLTSSTGSCARNRGSARRRVKCAGPCGERAGHNHSTAHRPFRHPWIPRPPEPELSASMTPLPLPVMPTRRRSSPSSGRPQVGRWRGATHRTPARDEITRATSRQGPRRSSHLRATMSRVRRPVTLP